MTNTLKQWMQSYRKTLPKYGWIQLLLFLILMAEFTNHLFYYLLTYLSTEAKIIAKVLCNVVQCIVHNLNQIGQASTMLTYPLLAYHSFIFQVGSFNFDNRKMVFENYLLPVMPNHTKSILDYSVQIRNLRPEATFFIPAETGNYIFLLLLFYGLLLT